MTSRSATFKDIEACLALQPTNRGDGAAGVVEALALWEFLVQQPFFLSAVLEADPSIRGHRLVGFGSAILVSSEFMEAEVANPRPNVTARIVADWSALASRKEVARMNAGEGIEVVILHSVWRDNILSASEKRELQTLLVFGLAEVLAGFRLRRILCETTSRATTDFHRRSVEYRVVAEFSEGEHAIYLMTRDSATAMPGSIGNVIYRRFKPVLHLRESDQRLLLAALRVSTDLDLAFDLGLSCAAVKARWRSIFARIAETMPDLMEQSDAHEGRGAQKRHRVLAYVRAHPEELRPYDWRGEPKNRSGC